MNVNESIVLPFCKEDFIGTSFGDSKNCPLARLCKRFLFPKPWIDLYGKISSTFVELGYVYKIGLGLQLEYPIISSEVTVNGKIISRTGFGMNEYYIINDLIFYNQFKSATIKLKFI